MNIFIRYKKFFFIIGFLALIFVLGYLLYSTFFKAAPAPIGTVQPQGTTTPEGLPASPAGTGQIITPTTTRGLLSGEGEQKASPIANGSVTQTTKLSDMPVFGLTMSSDGGDLQFYNRKDGKFYRIDNNGNAVLLSDKVFYNVQQVYWSPTKEKAILEYPDGANIVYNFQTNKQITIPSHWEDFNFSPQGDKIVMKSMGLDPANRWLAIANDDGSKAKLIEPIGTKDATVYPSWSPNNQSIAMFTEGVDFDRQEVFFVGLNNENFKSIVVEGRGFVPQWDPQGERLLYSVYSSKNEMKPLLWMASAKGDAIGAERKNLGLETWANKCAFANETEVYCAVPQDLEEGAGLFPELADNSKDSLYKVDIKTGMKKLIAVPDGTYNMSNLNLSQNGYYLYFTDKANNLIHKIKLK